MFGYLIADPRFLSAEQKAYYRSLYCGLCKQLADHYGGFARFLVHYDMVFLLLLDKNNDNSGITGVQRCPKHFLFKNCEYKILPHTVFLADMTMLLGYWQKVDQKQDEGSRLPHRLFKRWEKETVHIHEQYPDIYACIKEQLSILRTYELQGETNIELPSAAFSHITRKIFEKISFDYADLGQNIGKFIYLMDAACDLKHDLKHELYNPFVHYNQSEQKHLLHSIGQLCLNQLEQLKTNQLQKPILQNILTRGMWLQYYGIKGGEILEKPL